MHILHKTYLRVFKGTLENKRKKTRKQKPMEGLPKTNDEVDALKSREGFKLISMVGHSSWI